MTNIFGFTAPIHVRFCLRHQLRLAKFREVSNTYYQRLRDRAPTEYGGRPDMCKILTMEGSGANIHVARADYYCDGYRPSVYHFMVYIPKE